MAEHRVYQACTVREGFNVLPGLFLMLTCFGCVGTHDEIRNDSRNIKNNKTSFIYNAIPDSVQAYISPEYSTAINTFAVNLTRSVYFENVNKNLVISPFSVSRNLSAITAGTSGTAKQELLQALGGQAAIDQAANALKDLLNGDNSIILQCADALWIDSMRYMLNPIYKTEINKKFGVEIAGLDLQNKIASSTVINGWIERNTNHYIKSIFKPSMINQYSAIVLVNAIYFEADWKSPFDIQKTKREPFNSPDGTVLVDMMESDYIFSTYKNSAYHNAKVYYGTSGNDYFYLDIYMPVKGSIETFLDSLCQTVIATKNENLNGALRMPKFFFESDLDLVPSLKKLGIHEAFNPVTSDIPGIATYKDESVTPLYIQSVNHYAKIKADEEGTKAVAVTNTMVGCGSDGGGISPDIVLDKPFVYFIRAGQNGLVLFSGVVNKP
ncbi:MAG: serpin family protein [Fibrobacter sp.]|nr:serpin family protein [Fibrobacter sp.]